MSRVPKWYRYLWFKWAVVQFTSIFCVAAATLLAITGFMRLSNDPALLWPWAWAYGQLMVLFYMLHWQLQQHCTELDPGRTDHIVALVKSRSAH